MSGNRLVRWLKDVFDIGWTTPETQSIQLSSKCPRCSAIWPIWVQRNWEDGRVKKYCKACGFKWEDSFPKEKKQ